MNDLTRLRKLAGLKEAELNMGLPKEALVELEACLREAGEFISSALAVCQDISSKFGQLIPEQQKRAERLSAVLVRIQRLDTIPVKARADLLDDTITALTGFQYIIIPLEQVFVVSREYKTALESCNNARRRCYDCLKVVGVGWGD